MTPKDLQKIIEQLETQTSKDQASFGVFIGSGGEEFIGANKEGLQLFALELLKAINLIDGVFPDPEKRIIPIESKADWIDSESEIVINYVRPIDKRPTPKNSEKTKKSLADKLLPIGCIAFAIIIVAAIIVGLWTMVRWIF